jgi:hypothetical protein
LLLAFFFFFNGLYPRFFLVSAKALEVFAILLCFLKAAMLKIVLQGGLPSNTEIRY